MLSNNDDCRDGDDEMLFVVGAVKEEEEEPAPVVKDDDAGPEIDPADRSNDKEPGSSSQVSALARQLIDVIPEEEEHDEEEVIKSKPKLPSVATQTSPRADERKPRGGSVFGRLNPLKKLYQRRKRDHPPDVDATEEKEEAPSPVTEFTKDLIIQEVVSSGSKQLAQETETSKKETGLVVDTVAANDEDNDVIVDVVADARAEQQETGQVNTVDNTPTTPTTKRSLTQRLARGVAAPLTGCGCNKRSETPHPQRRVLTLFQRSRHNDVNPDDTAMRPTTTKGQKQQGADESIPPSTDIDSRLDGLNVLSDISGQDDLFVSEESAETATEDSTVKDVAIVEESRTEEQSAVTTVEERTELAFESRQIPALQKYGVWSGMKMYAKSLTIATGGEEEKEEFLAEVDDEEAETTPRPALTYEQIESLFAQNKGFSRGMKMYSKSIQEADEWAAKVRAAEEAARAVVEAARVEEEAKVEEVVAVSVQDEEPKAAEIAQVQSIDNAKEGSQPCLTFTGAFGRMYQQFAAGTICSFRGEECLDNMHDRACPRGDFDVETNDILLENSVTQE